MRPQAIARRIVGLASHLVPAWRRDEWRREWDAELDQQTRERPDIAVARSVGSIADATTMRTQAMYLDLWWGDLRFAWRNAAKRPAFTFLVVSTLALGIGAVSAVFALVDGVLLRPLPYPDPSRVVFVWQTLPKANAFELEATPFDFAAWRSARTFEALALISTGSFTLTGTAEPERIRGARVTSSLLPLLGIRPRFGRAFTPAEDADGAPPVAILSDGLWRRRFGAEGAILGRLIAIDGVQHTIVGVMPPSTFLPGPLTGDDELWLPARMSPAERDNAISHNYTIVGRLAQDATLAQASGEMTRIAATIAADHPDTHRGIGVRLVPVAEQTVGQVRPALLVLLVGIALLLVIACANAATLLLARASDRQQELALRVAIGATGARLLSLALAETLLLSILGALAGLAVGDWTLRALLPMFADALPAGAHIDVDARAALVTAGLSVVIGVVLAFMLAAHKPTDHLAESLHSAARSTGGARTHRLRGVLVSVQIALAVLLLAAGGLMIRSVVRLRHVQPGFSADHLLTFRIALPEESYGSADEAARFVDTLIARLQDQPGILAAAANSRLPFSGSRGANGVAIQGRPAGPGDLLVIDQREVTPAYFRTMGIRLVRGREFSSRDDARGEGVTVINRTMAERFWPGGNPLDQQVRVTAGDESSSWLRIVGIVDDVHHSSLAREPVPEMYRPYAQMPLRSFSIAIRTMGDPAAVTAASRSVVQELDHSLPIYDVRTMEARIANSVAQTRATASLLLATALLAALLASVAIYGSIWYAVAQRIPEIGVRLALGATPLSICRLVIGRALVLAMVGAAIGAALALAVTPLLGTMLFETSSADPLTYVGVVGGLLALAIAASVVPARRAMRVSPLAAIRN
ncbi:MAG TPA: ABC transporter permease [Vicinamibacterales bacterium]